MTHQDILNALEIAYSELTRIYKDHECIKYHNSELEAAIYHIDTLLTRVENHQPDETTEEELVRVAFSKMLGKKS